MTMPDISPPAPLTSARGQKPGSVLSLAMLPTADSLPRLHASDQPDHRESSSDLATDECESDSSGAASSQAELRQKVEEECWALSSQVQPFSKGQFEAVRTLQMAPRNQGQVNLMKRVSDGSFVAVKRMPNSWVRTDPGEFTRHTKSVLEQPWLDVGLTSYLSKQDFQYLCEPMGLYRDSGFTYVVSAFAAGGDLFGLMESEIFPGTEREDMIRPIVLQVFEAVRWLHDHGIAHRDISLENILLGGEDGQSVQLIDFGMATTCRMCTPCCGKKSYIAPEMYRGAYDPFMSDAFAVGVVIFSMAARAYPWNATRPQLCRLFEFVSQHGFHTFLQKRKVWKGNGETLWEVFSSSLIDLLEGTLDAEPKLRTTLGEKCFGARDIRATVWESQWLQVSPASHVE
jgi:serine/threonine protein kinase